MAEPDPAQQTNRGCLGPVAALLGAALTLVAYQAGRIEQERGDGWHSVHTFLIALGVLLVVAGLASIPQKPKE